MEVMLGGYLAFARAHLDDTGTEVSTLGTALAGSGPARVTGSDGSKYQTRGSTPRAVRDPSAASAASVGSAASRAERASPATSPLHQVKSASVAGP